MTDNLIFTFKNWKLAVLIYDVPYFKCEFNNFPRLIHLSF